MKRGSMDRFEACLRLRQVARDELSRRLLTAVLDRGITRIEPTFVPRGGLRYLVAEEVTGLDPARAFQLLENMHQLGIFRKVLYDKTVFCPDCGSHEISIHFNCPNCGSMDTVKLSLIEDMSCGYIDKEERFRTERGLVCPHCGRPLVKPGEDFRRVGIWYTCRSCESEFDIPIVTYTCRRCGRSFSMEESRYEPVYAYELDASVKDAAFIMRGILSSIIGLLRSRGFNIQAPGFVNGRSGEEHMFDLIAQLGPEKSMAIDVFVSDSYVPERVVTLMFAKLYDTAFGDAFLIAVPRLREEARRLANLYRIRLVEGSTRDEVLRNFRSISGLK
ncbi:MAG TPA: hypothetical protein ENG43_01040 [Candidatus Bathyarchaeota archaeon]|nr:hypothetical protein [Candidatus Bathyarchaeota archaeon]HEW89913.1 hypothetical protein [Candidatus Bathyarchaeota archaeon]